MAEADTQDSAGPKLPSPGAFSTAKRKEWSVKCAYPRTSKIGQLRAKLEPAKNKYYSFVGSQLQPEFTEALRLLGLTSIDASDAKALEKLSLTDGSVLIVGPEVAAALRQREDHSRFACCLTYWEQRLHCLDSYWLLHDALESFEQSLRMFSRMGLLEDVEEPSSGPSERISYRDILLPTVHLGEVWGRRLSLFLKAHDCFRVKRAAGQAAAKSVEVAAANATTASSTTTADLIYQPASSENSGRKRLEILTEKLAESYPSGEDAPGPAAWSGLILQAYPEAQQILVTDRQFTMDTFLLLAPRRNPVEFGFAAFFHPGLVRVNSLVAPQEGGTPPANDSSSRTLTWIPDQLSDYLAALDPDKSDWLKYRAYPQMEAACAYLATALAQQLLDSALARFHLLRLTFLVDAERRQPRLTDLSQRVTFQASSDYCESLVMPRLLQEAAFIVAELLLRPSREQGFPASELVAPHNMKLVYDSAAPEVQRNILSHAASLADDGTH